jgi:nucleoside-diphosphate-sugar epimerase
MATLIKGSVLNKVKRIVVTSSITTITGKFWKQKKGSNVYNENDFTPYEEHLENYTKCKII